MFNFNVLTRTCATSINRIVQNRLASTYKAAVIKEAEKPLEIVEKKPSKLAPNQVRVRVSYCSVNSVDCTKFKAGQAELPFVPGYELSGEILEVGKEVTKEQITVGEKVVGLNLESFGGFAQQCVLDVKDVWRIPGELERKEAAVIAFGHSTAVYAFSRLAQVKEKEKVVVSAGPAGLGLAAVDVAANIYNAQVIGIVDTEERGELIRTRGAFQTVHFSPKLNKQVLKATDGKGASVVFDGFGEMMMDTIGSCVKVGGKVLHAAPFFYKTLPAPIPHSFLTIVSLKALRKQDNNLYRTVVSDTLEMASEGVLGAHVSAKFCLKDVNQAVAFINEKKCTGKVLIEVED